ncbi:MAG: hypothetical protein GTO24_21295 [candidate division Zixibacteria bacterium]|nr:hypothetical protein [candidate division Zixibacteria bacterium]
MKILYKIYDRIDEIPQPKQGTIWITLGFIWFAFVNAGFLFSIRQYEVRGGLWGLLPVGWIVFILILTYALIDKRSGE